MKADADAAIEAFGKNEQVKRVFWTLFVAMAGLVLARVGDSVGYGGADGSQRFRGSSGRNESDCDHLRAGAIQKIDLWRVATVEQFLKESRARTPSNPII